MKSLFHTFISLSLLSVGEYTMAIFMQFLFLITFKSEFLYKFFYLVVILFVLVKLFASTLYILYFFNLFLFIYTLYKEKVFFYVRSYFLFIFNLLFIATIYIALDEMRYELYLWLNITDVVNSINTKVIYLLTSLHLIILFIMGYNREKLF